MYVTHPVIRKIFGAAFARDAQVTILGEVRVAVSPTVAYTLSRTDGSWFITQKTEGGRSRINDAPPGAVTDWGLIELLDEVMDRSRTAHS